MKECPNGKRIDYIMYNTGPNITGETISCVLPLPARVPGKNISYSDHEGVAAKIKIKRNEEMRMTSRDFVRMQSMVDLPSKTACVQEAINILRASLKSVKFARLLYLLGALLCFVLLIGAFIIPAALSPIYLGLDLLLFIVRLFLIVCTTYLVLMSLLFLDFTVPHQFVEIAFTVQSQLEGWF